jgi:hypothetical protein
MTITKRMNSKTLARMAGTTTKALLETAREMGLPRTWNENTGTWEITNRADALALHAFYTNA